MLLVPAMLTILTITKHKGRSNSIWKFKRWYKTKDSDELGDINIMEEMENNGYRRKLWINMPHNIGL